MNRFIHLFLSIAALLLAILCFGCGTEPVGTAGKVKLDKTAYTGIVNPMTITLVDPDLTTGDVDVKVTSSIDPIGTMVKLTENGNGGYYGMVAFSTVKCGRDTLQVEDGAQITVTYTDIFPKGDRVATATWIGMSGTIALDLSAYTGTKTKMTITVVDADIRGAVPVVVKSDKDTVGITVMLNANGTTAGTFTGQVGFSFSKSGNGIIAVGDSNTVKVIYHDMDPFQTVSATAKWFAGMIQGFGIYGAGVTPGNLIKSGFSPTLFPWTWPGSGTCTVDSTDSTGANGTSKACMLTATGGNTGFGWGQSSGGALSSLDMSTFSACSLHVMMKGNAPEISLLVENLSHTSQTWVTASTYGYVGDGAWHAVIIPLSAWSATCDLSGVSYFLGATLSSGQSILLDDVYWTLPATNP